MNLIEVLDELEIPYRTEGHEHCRPGWVNINCPKCAMPDHFRLGLNLRFSYGNCWSCGSQQLIPTLMEISGRPYRDVAKLLEDVIQEKIPEKAARGKLVLPPGLSKLRPEHRKYLIKRGFSPTELSKRWGIQALSISVPFYMCWRIFIPIHYHGDIVSWTTRAISADPDVLRYISAKPSQESMDHKELLYGEDLVRGDSILVTEGPTDAWSIGPGAVATCGTAFSRAQVNRILAYPKRIICFDNSPAAQSRARILCDQVEPFPGQTFNVCLKSKDAAESSPKEIKQLRRMIHD